MRSRFQYVIGIGLTAIAALSSCKKGGSVSDSGSSGGGGGGSNRLISVSTFQGQESANWISSGGSNYTSSQILAFTGTCGRGVLAVQPKDNATNIGTAVVCTSAGTWTATFNIGADGTYTLNFVPVMGDNTEDSSQQASFPTVVDTVAPTAPVVTNPASSPFNSTSMTLTVTGTTSGDTDTMTTSSAGTFSFNSGASAFTQNITLTDGESRTITYTAYDIAGNASTATSIVISYISNTVRVISGTNASGASAMTDSGYVLVGASSNAIIHSTNPRTSDVGGYKLHLGETKTAGASQ